MSQAPEEKTYCNDAGRTSAEALRTEMHSSTIYNRSLVHRCLSDAKDTQCAILVYVVLYKLCTLLVNRLASSGVGSVCTL